MMKPKRIGVVMGGTSAEREVSLRSGRAVAHALERAGHDVVRLELGGARHTLRALGEARLDVAFLALHGRLGEDGCIQGMLELLGVPYTGSSVLGSALAMDKAKAKELFRLHNVPTPAYYVFEGEGTREAIIESHSDFGYPAMVKPSHEGSSVGLQKVHNLDELVGAVLQAQAFDPRVLVERFVNGREITVGILNGQVLGCLEVAPAQGVYDYQAKYRSSETQYFTPPRMTDTQCRGAEQLALRAAKSLGVTGAARVDLIVSEQLNDYVLEVNTQPGMTQTSLLPKIAEAAGLSFTQLCEQIVQGARLHVSQQRQIKEAEVVPLTTRVLQAELAAAGQ
jgi:D-alanine-D-alanine ligase